MRSSYKVGQEGLYFITSTIIEWLPIFTSEKYFEIITNSLTYCQLHKQLKIFAYVIMDNHIHLITYSDNLSNIIKDFKRHTAKEILVQLNEDKKEWLLNQLHFYKKAHKIQSDNQIWQESFHPQIIYSDHVFKQKIEYIHFNPVRKGFVCKPEHWRFSSAAYYSYNTESDIKLDELEW